MIHLFKYFQCYSDLVKFKLTCKDAGHLFDANFVQADYPPRLNYLMDIIAIQFNIIQSKSNNKKMIKKRLSHLKKNLDDIYSFGIKE